MNRIDIYLFLFGFLDLEQHKVCAVWIWNGETWGNGEPMWNRSNSHVVKGQRFRMRVTFRGSTWNMQNMGTWSPNKGTWQQWNLRMFDNLSHILPYIYIYWVYGYIYFPNVPEGDLHITTWVLEQNYSGKPGSSNESQSKWGFFILPSSSCIFCTSSHSSSSHL